MSDDPSCMSMITRYRDQRQCTALVPFFGQGSEGAQAWLRMHTAERRRIAMRAAREKDYGTLRCHFARLFGSWALSMMPVPVPSPEMGEAAIGVVRTGRLAAFTLTRILLAL